MLLKIQKNEVGEQLVSARELHEFLEVKSRFDTWFNRKVKRYQFQENQDYIAVAQKRATAQGNGYEEQDYILTLNMAKELSMIENNEKGRQARRYFIECEKALHDLKELQDPFIRRMIESVRKIDLLENEFMEIYKKLEEEYSNVEEYAELGKECLGTTLHSLANKNKK